MESIPMETLVPLICEVIDAGSEFRLYPRGKSMLPTIVEGVDSVMLAAPSDLKVMDAVLYRRTGGQYVLHRIVAKHGGFFDMCGDNQIAVEKNIPHTAVIAKVTGLYKGDAYISADDERLVRRLRRIYAKKPGKRAVHAFKRLLYPVYRLVWKRKS